MSDNSILSSSDLPTKIEAKTSHSPGVVIIAPPAIVVVVVAVTVASKPRPTITEQILAPQHSILLRISPERVAQQESSTKSQAKPARAGGPPVAARV